MNKNIPLDACYALGVLDEKTGPYDSVYIQVNLNDNDTKIQVFLNEDTCKFKKVDNLTNIADLIKLDVPNDIANFISNLNCRFTPFTLDISIPHMDKRPSMKEIESSIKCSKQTALLPVKYTTESLSDKMIIVRVSD